MGVGVVDTVVHITWTGWTCLYPSSPSLVDSRVVVISLSTHCRNPNPIIVSLLFTVELDRFECVRLAVVEQG